MAARKRSVANHLEACEAPQAFPVVGIGSSAGGLSALEAFFTAMPADPEPGIAFVLVQHLASEPKSVLAELLQRHTSLKVLEVVDGVRLEPNCIYLLPAQHDVTLARGQLSLTEPAEPAGQRFPIDHFFLSLADDQGWRSIGVILSGNGRDGADGVRAIKEKGGMVMVQRLNTCQYPSMPESALATGQVDYQLSPAQMPAQLLACLNGSSHWSLQTAWDRMALSKILIKLRDQTGRDFSEYKSNTILRRIERRLAAHGLTGLEAYLQLLEQEPSEVALLFGDLLIGVTSFFRDPENFLALENRVLPSLFADRPAGSTIRCWSAGCSSGEEAYSLAILLKEQMELSQQTCRVQIFATDLDQQAISVARSGVYPLSIAPHLTPERLDRFFTLEPNGLSYRVHPAIRDMLVFSVHDMGCDPPFSRLDLVVCRNVMIYMESELQKRLLPLFHYALKPGGTLFLGTSEAVGENADLFQTFDRKARLFLRTEVSGPPARRASSALASVYRPLREAIPRELASHLSPQRTLREMTEEALLSLVEPAVLVNERGDILYLHGRAGEYLEPSPGETKTPNVLRMARQGLQRELMSALRECSSSEVAVFRRAVVPKTKGNDLLVHLAVCPVANPAAESPLFLVRFEDATRLTFDNHWETAAERGDGDTDRRVLDLKHELYVKEEFLQLTNDELERTNLQLRSANEEMQSINEELQSTNEELETSKEELQSVNEELTTVNLELQSKIAFLSSSQNDLNNLLAGTGIATVFVDPQLRILRYTPAATAMVNLIPSDVGRPLSHLVTNLVDYQDLQKDAEAVLASLVPREADLETRSGASCRLRIQPYRTLENMVEGVVITFVDRTEVRRLREELEFAQIALQHALELARSVPGDSH